jgi:large subunit ribosomal protein L25
MQETFELIAESRSGMGKGASRRLRRTGKVPGIIYGAGKDPALISVVHNELVQHLEHEAFYSHILSVKVNDQVERVVLKDVQRHPAKPFVLHFDLLRVRESEKLKMNVPLHFVGEGQAPGVKAGGTASHHLTDVEITCLPKDLPEYIEVDVSGLDIGDAIHLSELAVPEGTELTALAQGAEYDQIVVSVSAVRAEIGEEAEEEGEGAAEEGEEGGE